MHDARLNVEAAKLLGIARGISGCFGVQGTPVFQPTASSACNRTYQNLLYCVYGIGSHK